MTKNGAIAKAKRETTKMNNITVIAKNNNYDVIHTEYLDEFIEDGYTKVFSFIYDYGVVKEV